jgi:2,5-diamino-6-(ribosylamino)-4(3H)-pyrimidinone 5'-phosphate reductase
MDRPYIICHMCTTIDGKTLSARWGTLPGAKSSADLFETTATQLSVGHWVVGTTTMREFAAGYKTKLPTPAEPVPPGDFVAAPKRAKFAIGTDARGELRFDKPDVDGDPVVILTTAQAPAAYLAHLQSVGVSYLLCGPTKIDLPRAMRKLHKAFGLKKLVVQGGGTFNGAMLHAGLIDEVSQVVVPIVDGGGPGITGFFDPPGKPAKAAAGSLKLVRHEPLKGGVHWFRWRVRPAKGE